MIFFRKHEFFPTRRIIHAANILVEAKQIDCRRVFAFFPKILHYSRA